MSHEFRSYSSPASSSNGYLMGNEGFPGARLTSRAAFCAAAAAARAGVHRRAVRSLECLLQRTIPRRKLPEKYFAPSSPRWPFDQASKDGVAFSAGA